MSYLHDYKKHKRLAKQAVEAMKTGEETKRVELISKIHKKNKNFKQSSAFLAGFKQAEIERKKEMEKLNDDQGKSNSGKNDRGSIELPKDHYLKSSQYEGQG